MTSPLRVDLTGKRALITGGGCGIGAGIARLLAQCGARVAVNYHVNGAEAKAVAAACGADSFAVGADVRDATQVAAMFASVERSWGGLDILINNAGWESVHHAIDLPEADFDRAIATNLKGPLLCAQQAARLMDRTRSGGVIVMNLSMHDSVPRKGLAHYCAAKAGLLMLTKCLALEFATFGVRVVGVSPGAIETDMNRTEIERTGREAFTRAIPLGRLGSVNEIAELVAWLVSPSAAYVTGATLYADGGYSLTTVTYDPRRPRNPTEGSA